MEADVAGLMDGQRALDPLDEQGTSILFEEESDPRRRDPFSNRGTKERLAAATVPRNKVSGTREGEGERRPRSFFLGERDDARLEQANVGSWFECPQELCVAA
jgi:hypothetical protein